MKNKTKPITHENFSQFIKQLENAKTKMNGFKIRRFWASCLNVLMSSVLSALAVCVAFGTEEESEEIIFANIPAFFYKVSSGVMGILPDGLDKWWICVLLLLALIPVTGLISGLLFRWLPIKGGVEKLEATGTRAEQAEAAFGLLNRLRSDRTSITSWDEDSINIYIPAAVAGIVLLALPIISLCRYNGEESILYILFGGIWELCSILLALLIVLCILCVAVFFLTWGQEWVTGLFYRSRSVEKDFELIKKYRELLEKEEEEQRKMQLRETEAKAVHLLISGEISASLKLLDLLGDEAKDRHYIEQMAEALVEDDPDVQAWRSWLDYDEEKINSEELRTFLQKQKEISRQKLLEFAEVEYPKALALLDKMDYESAKEYFQAADAIDYRDGVPLFALASFESGDTQVYAWVIERLTYGIEKGIESEKLDVKCRSALNLAKIYQRDENERKAAEKRAEDAYWLEVGRQMNMTCKYKQGDYCCWSCTLDNFPPLCFYRNNPRDMYMCDKRKR